jgi:hypothetical protein
VTRLQLNINSLLRANLDAKANYISKMFQCGGYTVNEARTEIGHPRVDGGDVPYVQINMQAVGQKPAEEKPKTSKK